MTAGGTKPRIEKLTKGWKICDVEVPDLDVSTVDKYKVIAMAFGETFMFGSLAEEKAVSNPVSSAKRMLDTESKSVEEKKEILLQFIKQLLDEKITLKAAKAVWSYPGNCPADFGTSGQPCVIP